MQIDLTKDLDCDNLLDKLDDLSLNSGLLTASGLQEDDNKEINSFDDLQGNFEKEQQHKNTINRRLTHKEQDELKNVTML